ncbi:MAG: FG-GAP-like repeat-containing protein [bacterium]
MKKRSFALLAPLLLQVLCAAWPGSFARADMPYPAPPQGVDVRRYEQYCRIAPDGPLPANYSGSDVWKYSSERTGDARIDNDPRELYGVTGMSVERAWEATTGRPDVVIAVLDSGILWDDPEIGYLVDKFHLNDGELPPPEGGPAEGGDPHDRNGDGVFNMEDYAGDERVPDSNGNGIRDPEDLILAFSNGADEDGNGYVDDICGWDLVDDDNDPRDDVSYGHGTGEAKDSCAEARSDRQGLIPGTCPNCRVLPIRVGLSFIAEDMTFGRGVIFAVDSGADVVQEALGTLNGSVLAQAALRYAYAGNVPVIASAADESSLHANLPAAHEHTITVNSVTRYHPEQTPRSYLYLNGCTNYGGNIATSVSSESCSSEATGRGAGIAGLVVSAALNEVARGNLDRPLTANEVKQILTMSADDIDFSGQLFSMLPLFPTRRFPSGPGWDAYFGYGRLNAARAVGLVADLSIPPEADITSPLWFETIDPARSPRVPILGYAAARRTGAYAYRVEYGRGIQPAPWEWHPIFESSGTLRDPIDGLLATWEVASFLSEVARSPAAPNDFTFTLRLAVTDAGGLQAESRKTVYLHHDPQLKAGFPVKIGGSGESHTITADLDGDNLEDLVLAASDGVVHALKSDGSPLSGWPVATDLLEHRYTGSHAYRSGAVDANIRESVGFGGVTVGDLDRDGDLEVVCASLYGKVYVWEHDGAPREGFPVSLEPAYSLNPRFTSSGQIDARDRFNRRLSGVISAPVLEDLDRDGKPEIICSALDSHVYAWDSDGGLVPGWPVLAADEDRFRIADDLTHRIEPHTSCAECRYDVGEIVSTPAVGDIDGDGYPEVVLGTNEQYGERMNVALSGGLIGLLGKLDLGGGNGRLHALHHDGTNHPGGPFVEGWPVRLALVEPELLPFVGSGTPGSPVLADVDGNGSPEIAAFSTIGPAYLLNGDGSSYYGLDEAGDYNVMETGPLLAGHRDVPSIPVLGSPILADLEGDGTIACIAPSAGFKKLADVQLPAEQIGNENHLSAWTARDGKWMPGFPVYMDDLQFASSPSVADVDGDGRPEVLAGSGGFLVRAYDASGTMPAGWPKFTGKWVTSTPAVGDVDGDGLVEVAVTTRSGDLYVWETAGAACEAANRQWRTFHHDAWRTGSRDRDVTPPARPLDLRAETTGGGELRLSWSATGDDGLCDAAAAYEIRGSGQDLDSSSSWSGAARVASHDQSEPAGSGIALTVADPGFAYYGIQAADEAGNLSRVVAVEAAPAPSEAQAERNDDDDSGGLWLVSTVRPAGAGSCAANLFLLVAAPLLTIFIWKRIRQGHW